MRYSHNLTLVRRRHHVNKLTLLFSVVLLILIAAVGFTFLDAKEFFGGFVESFVRVLAAYGISLIIGIGLMLFVTQSAVLESLFIPVLDALQSFPSFALFPLFVVWWGRSSIVTIIILVIEMIWPILFTLLTAKKQLREDVVEAATIFGASGIKYLWYILFPLLFPAVVTGSIVAWGEAWEAIIAAEIIVAVPGVGSYLAGLGMHNQTQNLIVGIVLLLTILYIVNKFLWLNLLTISTRYQQD